jgi:hypothetical protein
MDPFPPVLTVETPEHEALWREGVQLASEAYQAARICWNCHALWEADGQCPTKGCRGKGSGFEQVRQAPSRPCVMCGTLTRDRYIGGIFARSPEHGEEEVPAERIVRCPSCEAARNRQQAVRLAPPLTAGGPEQVDS